MAFQKFVAWGNVPSLVVKPDAADSSSSSNSEHESVHESEKNLKVKLKATMIKPEIVPHSKIEIPPSVKNVLDKLDLGQLERARKEISKKLCRILDNVNRTYEHYKKDDGIDPEMEKEYHFSQTWEERNRRSDLLDAIADVLEESKFKIQELQIVLESFKNFYESLKTIDWKEKETSDDDMIDDMEERLLKFINSIDNNIQRLIKIFYPLIKEKTKPRRKSTIRPAMFKAWCDKVAEKPKEGEPLTPERMLEDEHLTLTHCNDVVLMTQEMVDSPIFNRTEHDAVKYIAVMVANLTKAFNLLSKQCRGLKIKYDSLAALDTRKQDPQVGHLQRELRAALDKKAALEIQVHTVEERCKILLITNETMQKELQDANERAMTMGKVSFPKLPSKAPEKVSSDAEKEVKSKKEDKSHVKPPAPPVTLPSAKPDEKEKQLADKGKVQITVPEKEGHLPPHSISTQEGGIKLEEKDQFPEAVVAADISFGKHQPDIAQKSRKEKVPLEERAPKTPEEKSLLEKKAQKTQKEKASLEEKRPESPEEEAALEEETPLIDTTKEDGQALEKQLSSEGKGQVAPSKQKTFKAVRRPSKLSKWRNVQTSLLKQPTKSRDETTLSEPPEENVISDDTSVMQLSILYDTAVTQPAIPDDTSVTQPATVHDTAVTQPATTHDTAVTQPATTHDIAVTQPATTHDTAVTQPATFDHAVVTQPVTLDDVAVAQPEMLGDTRVTKSTYLRDTEESLLQASVDSPPKPGAEKDSPSTSPEGELPPLRRQSILDISTSSEKTHDKRTAGKIVETIKEKKVVKFTADSMVQITSESREMLDAQSPESPQAGTAEGAEDSAVDAQHSGTLQPQKRLAGKGKEIHEKKDTKRTGKMTASVPQSKQAEKIGDVLHGLEIKLQDIARDRGGVIEAETIKEVFEELSITYHDTAQEQMAGSHSIDKPSKESTAQKPSLLPTAAEHAPRKEGQKSLEDVSSVQDVSSALQEFQSAILACLEDKLVKARKGSPDAQKQSVKFQPRDPQVQQLFQAIDKKLEEYTSMKQKIPIGVKKHKMLSREQAKEDTPEREEREVKVITSPFDDTLPIEDHSFSSSSFSLSRTGSEEQTTSGEASQLMAWEEKEEELEHEVEKEIKLEEEVKKKKQEEEEEIEQIVEQERKQKKIQGQLKKLKEETKYQRERISSLGGQLDKLEEDEDEDVDQLLPPQEEKRFPEHLPFERPFQDRAPWWDRKKQSIQKTSDEQFKHIGGRKVSKPVSERVSLQESDEDKELWKEQLQEETEQLQGETERLQGEKERLQEELRRLQEERQRLEEEEKQLEQWKQMFEQQRLQWEFEKQQHKEQEHLWHTQLQHWEQLQQQNEEQAQQLSAHREQQKDQQSQLQEEIQRLQEEYREYLRMRGEQAEEQWRWSQLRTWHQQQEVIWQEEDQEHEQKRAQWQEQLAQQQEQIESLQRERKEQEQEMKKWQQEQQERQNGLQQLWEKWWQRQLESWHRQMKRQRAQHHKWQEHSNQLQEEKKQQMTKEARSLAPQLKVVEGSALDPFSKHYKASPTPKERRPSTTPQLTPIPSGEFAQDTLELETTWFPKLFSKSGDVPAPDVTEKRYLLNVEGQRKNLELLKEAAQNADISPELYTKAKLIISQAMDSNVERLALLFRKYKTLHHLQEARRSLTIQLDAAKDIKDGSKMQNLYKMVGNLDAYQKKVLDNWTVKQNAVEKKRRKCIEKMTPLFAQIRMSTKLRLSDPHPLMVKAEDYTKKEILHMPQIGSVFLKTKVGKSPLISVKKPKDFTCSSVVREPTSEQLESLWKTDITELSIPLGPKTPVSVMWSEAYGFPDIPRLLELDISSIRKKPLRNLKTRIQNIPRWKISGYNFMHL